MIFTDHAEVKMFPLTKIGTAPFHSSDFYHFCNLIGSNEKWILVSSSEMSPQKPYIHFAMQDVAKICLDICFLKTVICLMTEPLSMFDGVTHVNIGFLTTVLAKLWKGMTLLLQPTSPILKQIRKGKTLYLLMFWLLLHDLSVGTSSSCYFILVHVLCGNEDNSHNDEDNKGNANRAHKDGSTGASPGLFILFFLLMTSAVSLPTA
jgi:hypothetical protein